jgi:hypothetical protein
MASMAEEFAKSRYKPKYEFMARVEGKYKNIPFVGSVGNDTVINDVVGPVYHIHLDLPMKVDGKYIEHLFCKHSEIKGMKRR